ncbi:MAG TPA: fatty acid--CoA ligase family protein [Ruminiclostridium sp.]|nr:fatty acid--CoA ligase family protein [Ruminiclostridium sp.]
MSDFFRKLEQGADTLGSKVVLKDPDCKLTLRQLWDTVRRNRKILALKGIEKGMTVSFKMESNLDWAISFLSLISLGVRVLPVAPDISEQEMSQIKENLRPDYEIDKEEWTSIISETPYKDIEPVWPEDEDEVLLQPTSGSTGNPRYCVRTIASLVAEGNSYKNTLGLAPDDIILNPLPLHHSYSLGMALMGGLVSYTSIIFVPRFSPRDFLKRLQQEKVTVTPVVPVIARYLVNLYSPGPVNLPCLRIVMAGAGKVPPDTYEAFYKKFGIWLSGNYGSTETGAVCSRLEPELYPAVGRPMWGMGVEIRDDEGRTLPISEEGHVWVKTPGKLKRYWGNNEQLDKDSFFPMGDLGYLNEAGALHITGRSKSMINVGGKKVNPSHVEEILLRHPKVKDAAVVGVPRSSGEEAVKAVVVAEGDIVLADLNAYIQQNLSDYEKPTRIKFVKALPRNELGKVKSQELISI